VAAEFGNLTLAQRFVNAGVALSQRSGILGGTAINLAASKGHIEVVQYLLSAGTELDVSEPQRNPSSPRSMVATLKLYGF
jgi:hypothetical protein